MIKKLFITSLALTLSACGFTPMNAPANIGDTTALKNISVELIEPESIVDREAGYYIQQHLRDRVGANKNSTHVLKFEPRSGRSPYGVTSNDVATRYDLRITAEYVLLDRVTGETLDKGDVRAVSTFGSSRDPYARITAEKTATDQVSRQVADRLIIRLASYYKDPERKTREREAHAEELKAKIAEAMEEQGNQVDPDEIPVEELTPGTERN